MPNMSGMELLQKIRKDSRFDYLPVIFQTALSSRDEMVEGIRAGVFHYLTKPYDQKVLLAMIDVAINDTRRHQSLEIDTAYSKQAIAMLHKAEFRFQTITEAEQLARLLATFSPNPEKVVIGLSELMVNAVEHGSLGITYQEKTELVTHGLWRKEVQFRQQLAENQHKFVQVKVLQERHQTTYTIKDQGAGFDPSKYLGFDLDRVTDVHGRGIAMSKMRFSSLEYQGCGNQVVAKIDH